MAVNLGTLVDAWSTAISAAEDAKAPFMETASICNHFFTGSMGFMWDKKFKSKYLNGIPEPKFAITIAKAFELVSIVGPTLMWAFPQRTVVGYNKLDIDPMVFGILHGMSPEQPEAQMMAQQYAMEAGQELIVQNTRNELMSHYLNYSHREQPGGGLVYDSRLAIIEALVKGRGVIKVDTYQPANQPNSSLTGGFYVSVDDLFIDPDCTRANLSNAKWIAIRHVEPHDVVEKRFGYAYGALKGKSGNLNTKTAARTAMFSKDSKVSNLVVWFEIFSKCGCGTRLKGAGQLGPAPEWHDAFEQVVGDYAYICMIKGHNELLNLHNDYMENATTEQVKASVDWPIPYYEDGRWPVALLDFWHNPNSPWPIAPLAMGLGELICINVLMSSLIDRVYQDGLVKAAIKQELADEAIQKLLSYSHEVIELNPDVAKNINEVISFLERPRSGQDIFAMLNYLFELFDKRVGLMELMYGLSSKVDRTATAANIKGEAISVRPEYMAVMVEGWQTEIANLERIAAGYSVAGETLAPLLGGMGSQLWTKLITEADPVVYMREMRSQVEANSARKPNKAKDNQNLNQLSGFLLPVMQWYAQSTGNTEPLNAYIKTMGKAIDQDVDPWMLPPLQNQGPSPEEMQAQQEMQELMKSKLTNDIKGRELKNAAQAHKMMQEGAGLPMEMMTGVTPDPELMSQQPLPQGF
jgi:hypothetical protein